MENQIKFRFDCGKFKRNSKLWKSGSFKGTRPLNPAFENIFVCRGCTFLSVSTERYPKNATRRWKGLNLCARAQIASHPSPSLTSPLLSVKGRVRSHETVWCVGVLSFVSYVAATKRPRVGSWGPMRGTQRSQEKEGSARYKNKLSESF